MHLNGTGEQAVPDTGGGHPAPRKAPAEMLQEGTREQRQLWGRMERAVREADAEGRSVEASTFARGKAIHPAEPRWGPSPGTQGVISDQI